MIPSIDIKIKGSFKDAIAITSENLDDQLFNISPSDMKKEITDALTGVDAEPESVVYYASWLYAGENESRQYVLFPNAGRGGVCTGGYTEWCDATTLDEIEAAYEAGTLE